MPNCEGVVAPRSVLILEGEDSPGTTHSRLCAAGADLDRVFVCDQRSPDQSPIQLPTDIPQLETHASKNHVGLIVIDPIAAFAEGNLNNDQSARRTLTPLVQMAERLQVAVILIRHLSKSGSANPLLRGAGSIGIAGAARSVLLVAKSPSDPEQRIVASVKSNLCRSPTSLAFVPVSVNDSVRINWVGQSQLSARDLIGGNGDNQETLEAVRILYWLLEPGRLPVKEVITLAAKNGVTESRLRKNAKKILGVNSKREGFGPGSIVYWQLPDDNEIVQHLRDQDLSELMDRLIDDDEPVRFSHDESGDDEEDGPDPADWWKSNEKDDEDNDAPSNLS